MCIRDRVYQAYRDRSILLTKAKRYPEAFEAFEHTMQVQDSILTAERRERLETIRRQHDLDKRKLAETRALIRNRAATSLSIVVIVLLMSGTGIYLLRSLLRNRRLKADILRHSRKAQESEHMKSVFVNTICRGIGPAFDAIDTAASRLMPVSYTHLDVYKRQRSSRSRSAAATMSASPCAGPWSSKPP